MNKTGRIFLSVIFLAAFLPGCTKNEKSADQASLLQAINQSAGNLNNAMSEISSSKVYSILTISGVTAKSAETDPVYKVYIPLDLIKGIYNYKPFTKSDKWGTPLLRYFLKSADDNKMIVKMPLKKITQPGSLRHFSQSDSLLVNNFSISVSAYHNNYNNYHDFDYNLVSEISIDNSIAGNLNIESFKSPVTGTRYASQYAFTEGYTANYKYVSGDTTLSSFAIKDGAKVLYEEKLLTSKNDTAKFGHERTYILTIGNVQIIRKYGVKSIQVAVNGVMQTGAVVSIIDKEADSEASVCKKRDIQITFEDGTVTSVSQLISSSVEDIKTLYSSLHEVYFAAYVIDWIAYDIYYQR